MTQGLYPILVSLLAVFQQAAIDPVRVPFAPNGGSLNSVALDGDNLAVGAPLLNQQIGGVHVFKRNGSDWEFVITLTPADGQPDDMFGFSVALEGDNLVVGAPHITNFIGGTIRGSAYLYQRTVSKGSEQWVFAAKLPAPPDPPSHYFGYDVAISDAVIVIGEPGEIEQGAAHVYRHDGDVWISDGVLPGYTNSFGKAVDIDQDAIVVGVPGGFTPSGSSGYAAVYRRKSSGWVLEEYLLGSGLESWDKFGSAVSISGDRVIVGAPEADGGTAESGSAFVFRRQGDQWPEEKVLFNPKGQGGDRFGGAVRIAESIVTVGAYSEARDDAENGAVYVFDRRCDEWKLATRIVSDDSGIAFGGNLSLDQSFLAVNGVGAAYTTSLASLSSLARYAGFQNCFGEDAEVHSECAGFDAATDGLVDLSDYVCFAQP